MAIRRIRTEQAPSAKPVAVSLNLTTDWQMIIDAPEYDVPVVGFGTARRIAPGVAEISSPLMVTNLTGTSASVSCRVFRALRPMITGQTEADFPGFQGGQGYGAGATLTLSNSAEVLVDAVDPIGTVTEFTVVNPGSLIFEGDVLDEVLSDTGLGQGFSITAADNNLVEQAFNFATNFPVEPRDTAVIPLNGQFLLTGDRLEVISDTNDALQATISYTEGQSEEDDLITDIPIGD